MALLRDAEILPRDAHSIRAVNRHSGQAGWSSDHVTAQFRKAGGKDRTAWRARGAWCCPQRRWPARAWGPRSSAHAQEAARSWGGEGSQHTTSGSLGKQSKQSTLITALGCSCPALRAQAARPFLF